MIESFIHSDYQIPEITRKLTLGNHRTIANLDVGVRDGSRVARVDTEGRCLVERYSAGVFAGLANLFVCDGAPGPVLEVEVGHRVGAEGYL